MRSKHEVSDQTRSLYAQDIAWLSDIYRTRFPDHRITIHLIGGGTPTFAFPRIIKDEMADRKSAEGGKTRGKSAPKTLDPDKDFDEHYLGQLELEGPSPDAPEVVLTLEIPREPTAAELANEHGDWKPRLPFRPLYAVSPMKYESLRYKLEERRQDRAGVVHSWDPLPADGGISQMKPEARAHFDRPARSPSDARPAILIGFHWLEIGGAEKLAFDTVTWALAAGLRVFVVASVPEIHRMSGKLPDSSDVTFIRLDRYLQHHHWAEYLETLIARENIRLIHIHHCTPLYASLAYLKVTTPWVKVIDSTHIIENADGGYPRVSGVHTNLIDMHHVISDDLGAFYQDRFGAGAKTRLGRLLPQGRDKVDLPPLSMAAGKTSVRFVFVGRLFYQKRPIVVTETLRALEEWCRSKGIGFEATIVGDGPFKTAIAKLLRRYRLKDKIELLPGNADIPALLDKSDVLLLPSNNEGLALVCYEAIEHGCIPISTDVGAQKEIVPQMLLVPTQPTDCVTETVAIMDRLWSDQDKVTEAQTRLHDNYRSLAQDPTAEAVLSEIYRAFAEGKDPEALFENGK